MLGEDKSLLGEKRRGTLMLVAGEASGDLHGARLISELENLAPGYRLVGLGGDRMTAAGLESVAHASEISVVGFTEVLKILPRAREIFHRLLRQAAQEKPDAAILIDSPGFNLRLARKLAALDVPVLYYISPQVWAWRQGRVRQIARRVDKMMVLFPFELDFYRDRGVDVVHVGHPLVDEVPVVESTRRAGDGEVQPYRIALLPGSRPSEVRALLPTFLEAASRLSDEVWSEICVIRAPTLSEELVGSLLRQSGTDVEVVSQGRFQAIADCDLALCASGTATLEVGMLGTPMVVAYKVGALTYALARRLVKVDHIALVNLVLGERVVPELIQGDANPGSIAAECLGLLQNEAARASMIGRLSGVRAALGETGASRRAALQVVDFLTSRELLSREREKR